MKKICTILRSRSGASSLISAIFVVLGLSMLIVVGIVLFGEAAKLDRMQQMAQLMAREISLRGDVNNVVNSRLVELEKLYGMEVDMTVDGDYIGSGKKLRLESQFTVSIAHQSIYGVGGILNLRREETYVRKASGIVEEYHK